MRILCLLTFPLLCLQLDAKERPNVLFLCIDDLRPELNCYGVDYIQSPNIDKLAQSGRLFTRHFVQAPTCGASRYALMTSSFGSTDNEALFKAAGRKGNQLTTLPGYFRKQGYTSVSVGKVSHHPGGRGGPDWNDEAIPEMPNAWDRHLMPTGAWQNPRGAMHGLANGEIRGQHKRGMDVFQSAEGEDSIYPDGLITQTALEQLDTLGNSAKNDRKPFFLAIGWLKPHLPFGAPAKYMKPYAALKLPPIPHPQKPEGITTWHNSAEFTQYYSWGKNPNMDPAFADEVRKHYDACVSFSDTQVGIVMKKLDELGLKDNTIIVIWGDHGWHLGEHAVWGKHTLFEEALRSPLIINYPGLPQPGISTDTIAETIDIFPTLCDLSGLKTPEKLDGTSLLPSLKDPKTRDDVAVSYWEGKTHTIRTDQYRLIRHPAGKKMKETSYELYDHKSDPGEAVNIASSNPDVVKKLEALMDQKLKP